MNTLKNTAISSRNRLGRTRIMLMGFSLIYLKTNYLLIELYVT